MVVNKTKVVMPPAANIEYLMTVPEVAAFFKVTEQTVRLWIKEKKIRSYRVPHPDGLNREIPASDRRTTLYFTRQSLLDWAETYYKL